MSEMVNLALEIEKSNCKSALNFLKQRRFFLSMLGMKIK